VNIQKPLSSLGISSSLKKYVNDFTILIYSSPEIMLFSSNPDKHFIYKKRIAIGNRKIEITNTLTKGLCRCYCPLLYPMLYLHSKIYLS